VVSLLVVLLFSQQQTAMDNPHFYAPEPSVFAELQDTYDQWSDPLFPPIPPVPSPFVDRDLIVEMLRSNPEMDLPEDALALFPDNMDYTIPPPQKRRQVLLQKLPFVGNKEGKGQGGRERGEGMEKKAMPLLPPSLPDPPKKMTPEEKAKHRAEQCREASRRYRKRKRALEQDMKTRLELLEQEKLKLQQERDHALQTVKQLENSKNKFVDKTRNSYHKVTGGSKGRVLVEITVVVSRC